MKDAMSEISITCLCLYIQNVLLLLLTIWWNIEFSPSIFRCVGIEVYSREMDDTLSSNICLSQQKISSCTLF